MSIATAKGIIATQNPKREKALKISNSERTPEIKMLLGLSSMGAKLPLIK